MNENELTECFEFVQDLVHQCGPVLLEGFKDCGIVETKTNFRDVVTKYDREIEGILMAGIRGRYPGHW
jgi:fructose-1,6-bisphosphatase/inositol monophosphatase family enzyme